MVITATEEHYDSDEWEPLLPGRATKSGGSGWKRTYYPPPRREDKSAHVSNPSCGKTSNRKSGTQQQQQQDSVAADTEEAGSATKKRKNRSGTFTHKPDKWDERNARRLDVELERSEF